LSRKFGQSRSPHQLRARFYAGWAFFKSHAALEELPPPDDEGVEVEDATIIVVGSITVAVSVMPAADTLAKSSCDSSRLFSVSKLC